MERVLGSYLKVEWTLSILLFILGIAGIAGAIYIVNSSVKPYAGLAYTLFPLATLLCINSFPQMGRVKSLINKSKNTSPSDLKGLIISERKIIEKDLEGQRKHSDWLTGTFAASVILVFVCFFGASDSLLLGIGAGICMVSVTLLSYHTISVFAKKLFIQESEKYCRE